MTTIIISEFMDAAAVKWLTERFEVFYDPELYKHREKLLQAVATADALIVRNQTLVDTTLLARQKHLRIVGRLGVGVENIDVDRCQDLGVEVVPAIGANASAVAEYVICTSMMLLRRAYLSSMALKRGQWLRQSLASGQEIGGKVLGIIGLGSVGRRTAELAQAVGMSVIAHDPSLDTAHTVWSQVSRRPDLDDVLRDADVVSLHLPLTNATRNLIDARRLALMRPEAILINVARGGIVDETALAHSLMNSQLAGAALDVYEHEPLPAASVLAEAPNLILTPHIAGVTHESNIRVSAMIAERVANRLETLK